MKKIILLSTVIFFALTSCRQSDVLSNEDVANLEIIQNKRDIRNSEINNSPIVSYGTINNENTIISSHEPLKIPPKR